MMTPEPVPSETPLRQDQDERRKIIIALLFLLLAFSCIFCSSQSALWFIDRKQIDASMLSARRAEYGSDAAIALAPLNGSIAAEANRDEEQLLLKQTPIAGGLGVVVLPNPIPTPAPTAVALLPTPTPTLTPTVSAPSQPPPAPLPPTSPPPTSAPPTSAPTSAPPTAPLPTTPLATAPLPTVPPPTSPPPTVPPPTSPPPTSPPPTSAPPTATFTPTATPTATDTATATPPATATPTDTPTPPAVQFSAPAYTVMEDGGTAPITVTLSGPSALTVTVVYATANNTAIAGADYINANDTLTFAPGVTDQLFNVTIINDAGVETPDEIVNLTLANPANATLGITNTAILTIANDGDTGQCNPTPPAPPTTFVEIGPPDCVFTNIGGSTIITDVTATGGPPISIIGDGNPDFDLVYYERESPPPSPPGIIAMDMVQVAVSTDTVTWYTVFYWGDSVLDINTNIGQAPPPGPYGGAGNEPNDAQIPMTNPPLYQSSGGGPITGIAIDVDNPNPTIQPLPPPPLPPPPGSYRYVRLTGGGRAEVDSIEVLP